LNNDDMEEYKDNLNFESLESNPVLNYYEAGIKISEAKWQMAKAAYLPKFNIGYKLQAIDGNTGFHSWEIGVSVPVSYYSYLGKSKAAKINIDISSQNFVQKKLEINSAVNQLQNRYKTILEVLKYYQNEALPLAEEQIKASKIGYKLGSIDYIQFIQNIESAIKTKQEYLNQKAEYYKLKEELKYLTGK